MLDRDLAVLYGVKTRVLNQAVQRNIKRFPEAFMFALTWGEIRNISQIVISSKIKHAPKELEERIEDHDEKITAIFQALRHLMAPPEGSQSNNETVSGEDEGLTPLTLNIQ